MMGSHSAMQGKLIDLKHLDRYVAGDRMLRDEILGIFEEQAEMWIRALDPQQEDDAWKDAAHALKGASRGVGAWEVGELCEDAERLTAGGDGADLAARTKVLADLRAKVMETVAEVRALRAG